jgi:uncharacterized protein YecT (DUF1311 family)
MNISLRIYKLSKKLQTGLKSLALLFFCFYLIPTGLYAAELPDRLSGIWQVRTVHINMAASRRAGYGLNDPRLRGRLFNFSHEKVTNDTPEATVCFLPKVSTASTNIVELIGKSMAGYGYPSRQSTPGDYGIEINRAAIAEVISISCAGRIWEGGLGADNGPNGAWIFFRPDGELVLRWYDETILVLEKLDVAVVPRPSFNCSAAKSLTEIAICRSVELASFDRSIADAYKQLEVQERRTTTSTKELTRSQQRWVRKRNSCGSDSACISRTSQERLEELVSGIQS